LDNRCQIMVQWMFYWRMKCTCSNVFTSVPQGLWELDGVMGWSWKWISSCCFLTCWILGIMVSQIKIKWIFTIVWMIINLWLSKLEVDNLNWYNMINTNWSHDIHMGCEGRKHGLLNEFIEVEDTLMEDNE